MILRSGGGLLIYCYVCVCAFFVVAKKQDLRLKGLGGRVALILRLGIGRGEAGGRREVVVANTHLLFPHAR